MRDGELTGAAEARPPGSIAIVGLGLMGGSLARALSALAAPPRIVGWSYTAAEGEAALAAGVVDRVAEDLAGAVGGADLAVLAMPVGSIVETLGQFARVLSHADALTDLASVKAPVMAAALAAGLADRFVGGHPLTGSHEQGFAASRADLYRGARVYLMHEPQCHPHAMHAVVSMWRSLGALPATIDAVSHDALLAWTSHLPQAVAFALGATLAEAGVDAADLGPGGLDTTRLAGSPSALWTDILLHNAAAVSGTLDALQRRLEMLARALRAEDADALRHMFEASARWKEGA